MKRKEFLKISSLLATSSVFNPQNFLSSSLYNQNALKLKKGLNYSMIKEDISLLDKFKLVKDLGFDGIEIDSPTTLVIDEILEAKEKTGILIPSVINKDHWKFPLSDANAEVRNHTINSVAKSIEETKLLGGDTVLVVPGVVNEKSSYKQSYYNAIESIKKIIPHAEKHNIKIGLENVWNNFILSPIEALHFLNEINHPLVGWYFDIGNILRYGWPEHWIEVLEGKIFKLHVKEFSRKIMMEQGVGKGFGVELTKGDINWPAVMKKVVETNYKGDWMILELGGGDRNYLSKVSKELDQIISYAK